VIACGGGGIPVISKGNHLKGVGAVVDKDYASAVLAKEINADCLVILTAVEKVAINFGKKDEQWLNEVNVNEMKLFLKSGYFAPGSMKPKVEAAIEFVESRKDRYSIITLLEKAKEGILGKTGTRIVNFSTKVKAD
ncbi:MAG: carbamate kinase, partial [Clostridium saudiense]|nr:carbamate kinase [Clostridium saudiense]